MASLQPHFGTLNICEIKQKEEDLHNSNTAKNERKSVEAFKAYLKELNVEDVDFFKYTEQELNSYLSTFWWNACTRKGEKYKASSLETIRHSLKGEIKNYGHEYDITDEKCTSFLKSIWAFKSAMKELKQTGFSHVQHHKEIIPQGNKSFKIVTKL